jgi:hypothetical protein
VVTVPVEEDTQEAQQLP